MMRKSIYILFLLATVACSKKTKDKSTISVSILPQRYFVKELLGDTSQVNVLVPSGANPSTYEISMKQMKNLSHSMAYFRIGHIGFEEAWAQKIQESVPNLSIIDVSVGCSFISTEGHWHGDSFHKGKIDPHIWLSPVEVKQMIKNMTIFFQKYDQKKAIQYEENSRKLLAKVDTLDIYIKKSLADLRGKKILIFHPALTYYVRDYGLEQVSLEREGKSPTIAHVKKIIDLAKKEGIKVIFIQKQFDKDKAAIIAEEIEGEVLEIDPLREDWFQNMKEITDIISGQKE